MEDQNPNPVEPLQQPLSATAKTSKRHSIVYIAIGLGLLFLGILGMFVFRGQQVIQQTSISHSSIIPQKSTPTSTPYPPFIQNATIVYENNGIYLLQGIAAAPKLIDKAGHDAYLFPDHTKIAYLHDVNPSVGVDAMISQIIIYDIASGSKTVFKQDKWMWDTTWSQNGTYVVSGANSIASVYKYPTGEKLGTINTPMNMRTPGAIFWVDNNSFLLRDPVNLPKIPRCNENGEGLQIAKVTLPTFQKQVIIPLTDHYDFNIVDVENQTLYYEKQSPSLIINTTCTSPTPNTDRYWKASLTGENAVQITKEDISQQVLPVYLQEKLALTNPENYVITKNSTDNSWVLISLDVQPTLSKIYLVNLANPQTTLKEIASGYNVSW